MYWYRLLYVPFWCPENVHKDDYRWIHSSNPGHPELVFAEPHPDDSEKFYRYLFGYGIDNGMAGYEQVGAFLLPDVLADVLAVDSAADSCIRRRAGLHGL